MNADAELAALLHACKSEPDSPQPRRVLGDWLEEHGRNEAEAALAELLRRPGPEFSMPRWWASIGDEERPLAMQHKEAWLGKLASHRDWGMDRGLFTLRAEAQALADLPMPPMRGGRAWFARLTVEKPAGLKELLRTPWLAGYDGHLDLRDAKERALDGLDEEAGSLTGLGLDHAAAHVFGELCAQPHWRSIAALSVSYSVLSADSMSRLADAPLGQNLRLLRAERNELSDGALAALARSGSARILRGLEWDYNDSGDADMAALARMPELRHLSLTRNRGITTTGLESLCGAAFAPKLAYLSLAFLDLGDEMCRLLATAGTLASLERLDVSGDAAMTQAGIKALVKSKSLPALRWLGVPTRLKSGGLPSREGLQIA